MLNGKLVSLRAVEKEDAEAIRDWLTDPELLHLLGARPIPVGHLEIDKLADMFRLRDGRVLAILTRDRVLIGLAAVGNFHEFNRTASMIILIGDRSEWNRGYGADAVRAITKFAFDDLNLNCLEATIPEFNSRALSMFKKVGFQSEGTLRSRFFGRGRYWNVVVTSALRDEWSLEGQAQAIAQAAASVDAHGAGLPQRPDVPIGAGQGMGTDGGAPLPTPEPPRPVM